MDLKVLTVEIFLNVLLRYPEETKVRVSLPLACNVGTGDT